MKCDCAMCKNLGEAPAAAANDAAALTEAAARFIDVCRLAAKVAATKGRSVTFSATIAAHPVPAMPAGAVLDIRFRLADADTAADAAAAASGKDPAH